MFHKEHILVNIRDSFILLVQKKKITTYKKRFSWSYHIIKKIKNSKKKIKINLKNEQQLILYYYLKEELKN